MLPVMRSAPFPKIQATFNRSPHMPRYESAYGPASAPRNLDEGSLREVLK